MITLTSVSKSFGRLQVLKGIDLVIPTGSIVSMLGPNGSGKSTLMKCIMGLVAPNDGTIEMDGTSALSHHSRKRISYMPQVARFPENISARQLFELIAELRNEPSDPEGLIAHFNLGDHASKPLGELSGGSRQKVSAVLAFLFDTDYIVLDEPTVGLDPISRLKFKELVRTKHAEGKTIFFTSHIMSDIEEITDQIVFLLEGSVIFNGQPSEILGSTGQRDLEHAIAHMLQHRTAS
jgi:Cu-processing system ATP-binding protein